MEFLKALVYGIIQGVTEFLPISSDAHLIIIPKLLGWTEPSLDFDIALHLGTTAAVILFFLKDWIRLFKAGFKKPASADGKLFWFIIAATIPSGLLGLIFQKYAETVRGLSLISWMLIIMGLLLYFVDRYMPKTRNIHQVGLGRSLIIGAAQAIAMIPGVSRSGVTITASRFLGIKREDAAKFTFLLSTPTILGLCVFKIKDFTKVDFNGFAFLLAIVTSAVVGALCIKFLLNYIKNRGFGVFTVYRCALGVLLLILIACGVLA
ncbi:MAG: undecaprenyl-diphosphate phosphatase [Clostridia bacterium]|nr:undecaprenyl-diphosphate phosphatase [Clostridia bacterium]